MIPVKRYLPLALILAAGIVAIVMVQRKHIDTKPSADALLTATADAQHELTRVPAKLDPLLDPVLGTFTDADEVALGNVLAEHAAASLGVTTPATPHDAATQAYLQTLGARVAVNARRKLPWTFHYIPNPQFVNAFALPGGHVFIGQGLLKQIKSEDALAAVLGHEVEHIDLRHCAERAQAEARVRQLGAVGDLVNLPLQLFMAGYSKEQELEADRDGTTLAVQAGYSYTGIVALFNAFAKLDTAESHATAKSDGPLGEAAQLSLSTLSGYFASHPPSEQRAERIRELASERSWQARPLKCPPAIIAGRASTCGPASP